MSTFSGYALRFISGKYQGGEFPLPSAGQVVIGRGSDLDMVLVEDMVSRRHAMLESQGGDVLIQDMGSTNGTFVNGEKIKRAKLAEGDRVLIGTSILKLVVADPAIVQSSQGYNKDQLNAMLQAQSENSGASTDTMSGNIADIPLPDLLQMFGTNRKTGVLSVRNDEGDSGRIYLRDGRIFYALLNNDDELGPTKALFRMVAWQDGEFRLGPPSEDEFMMELDQPTEALIMEALRHLDELRQLESKLPEPEDMLTVPRPLEAPLVDLDRLQLEIFQLCLNLGFFQSVLDQSPYPDLQTATVVAALLERGYVRV